jgi:hypothetical protein
MVDASFFRQRHLEDAAAAGIRERCIFAVALAVILIGLGYVLLQQCFAGHGAAVVSAAVAAIPAREQISNDLLDTTKGLQITQQQAVDQLQVVQDKLAAQKEGTKSYPNRSQA